MNCACYTYGDAALSLNPCPEHERWARAIRDHERKVCSEKAREYAEHYPAHSDPRNTFVLLADWIDGRG